MDIYDFILEHEHQNTADLSLQKQKYIHRLQGYDWQWLVQQIEGRKVAKSKLPFLYAHKYIQYPSKISLEQCSSEFTARYKASLCKGKTLIDITGGFGIDCLFLSNSFEVVTYVEISSNLVDIFRHNLSVLHIKNIQTHNADGLKFLQQSNQHYDWIYIDPARRSAQGKKVFYLSDCEPDVLAYWNLLKTKAKNILIKTSPLLDISSVWQCLPITSTYVLAVKNEVKEVLYLIKQDSAPSEHIYCVDIDNEIIQTFEGNLKAERETLVGCGGIEAYLYEPSRAILKAGLFKSVALFYGLQKIAPNSHLYTSHKYNSTFMGRVFQVEQVIPYRKKTFEQVCKVKTLNIIARNFSDTPEQIAQKLGIQVGSMEDYLIATKDKHNQPILILAKRLK
ncbi:MAG: RsmD family RNA methyltransferase [Bacteroidia bacterium]|nr:RsmD family RNA methyltransferase [Bacteroidia bacterium]MDW8301364.1 class I SAM-dependent methyltransferase [Bacteroidia bacterium]